jgi:hypothetical protein
MQHALLPPLHGTASATIVATNQITAVHCIDLDKGRAHPDRDDALASSVNPAYPFVDHEIPWSLATDACL